MTAYSTILYFHVIAAFGLAGAMSVEGIALRQRRRASEGADLEAWLCPLPQMRVTASICLLVLLLSGGYLTERLSMWSLAWPKVSVLIVLAFGALAGSSGKRLGRIQRGVTASHRGTVVTDITSPSLTLSLSLRIGLVLAAVFLMVVKPNFSQSLGAVAGFVSIFFAAGIIGGRGKRQSYSATTGNLESSAR
jgi:hypothetical protein